MAFQAGMFGLLLQSRQRLNLQALSSWEILRMVLGSDSGPNPRVFLLTAQVAMRRNFFIDTLDNNILM